LLRAGTLHEAHVIEEAVFGLSVAPKMGKWRARTEIISNIALVACCILFATFLVKNHFLRNNLETKTNLPPAISLVGKKLSFDGIDRTKNQQTLLLVLQQGCRFCEESMPFYHRLIDELANQTKTHIIALLPHSNDENKRYLKDETLEIADVRQVSPLTLGVQGTPELLLLDDTGTIIEQWKGKLPPNQENDVISRLKR